MLRQTLFTLLLLTGLLGAHNVHLTLPDGWECVTDMAQLPKKVKMIAIGQSSSKFTPSINLATEETDLDIQEYVDTAKMYHESEPETEVTYMGRIPTKSGNAFLLQIDRRTDWGIVRFMQAALIDEETAYVVTATCLRDEFANYCGRFFDSIKSFEIDKKD
ncbi:MAG: hypothetical protein H7A36_01910 [Chlamydiales bacterium]|nr:hypothetical protein [Chlamydiales bacterium]